MSHTLEGNNGELHIELIGIGSAKHRRLKANLLQAMAALGIDYPIREVSQLEQLLTYNIGGIPALLINGRIAFEKVVPSVEDLKLLLGALLAHETYIQGKKANGSILVPTDFSKASENAYNFARLMAADTDSSIRIIHVEQPKSELTTPYQKQVPEVVEHTVREAMLSAFIEIAPPQAAELVVERTIVRGFVVDKLIERSNEDDVELIVMGMTGENDLLKKWIGSVSAKVAREAEKPVLLVPQGASFSGFRNVVYASDYHPNEQHVLPEVLQLAEKFGATIHFLHVDAVKNESIDPVKTGNFPVNGYFFSYARMEHEDVVAGINEYAAAVNADLIVMSTAPRPFWEKLFHRSTTDRMRAQSKVPIMVTHIHK
jgi:nucleotide-binding universal stress UspA family protein